MAMTKNKLGIYYISIWLILHRFKTTVGFRSHPAVGGIAVRKESVASDGISGL